jgi:hypothetical protein
VSRDQSAIRPEHSIAYHIKAMSERQQFEYNVIMVISPYAVGCWAHQDAVCMGVSVHGVWVQELVSGSLDTV